MKYLRSPKKVWTNKRIAIVVLVLAGAMYVASQAAAGQPYAAPLEAPGGAAATKEGAEEPPAAEQPPAEGIELQNLSLPAGA